MDIVIIGAGGHGRVVLEAVRLQGAHNPVGFLDADTSRIGSTVAGLKVLGAVNTLPKLRKQGVAGAIVAIGDNRVRASYAELVTAAGLELVSAIHPSSVVSATATVGRNVLVAAGAVVGVEARIADSAIINTGAIVDHECEIGQAAHICPGVLLAGRVRIGAGAFIGLGAKILPCLSIGDHAIIGAGAVVLEDLPAAITAVGIPARIVKPAPPQ